MYSEIVSCAAAFFDCRSEEWGNRRYGLTLRWLYAVSKGLTENNGVGSRDAGHGLSLVASSQKLDRLRLFGGGECSCALITLLTGWLSTYLLQVSYRSWHLYVLLWLSDWTPTSALNGTIGVDIGSPVMVLSAWFWALSSLSLLPLDRPGP